jgi:hypothetical protein
MKTQIFKLLMIVMLVALQGLSFQDDPSKKLINSDKLKGVTIKKSNAGWLYIDKSKKIKPKEFFNEFKLLLDYQKMMK